MVRLFLPVFLSLLLLFPAKADAQASDQINEVEEKIALATEKFNKGEEEESLQLYMDVLESDNENFEALWNASILYARQGYRRESEDEQEENYRKALELAQKAIDLYPDRGHSYYAWAVGKGRMTELLGTNERIEAAHDIKEKIEKAAEMIPDYARVWHLYGVWHSDVANVSGIERTAAGLFSGGLPEASNEKAEEFLQKATEMNQERILFRLDLAKHYIKTDQDEKAEKELEKIIKMEPVTQDDPRNIREAEKLLKDLNGES